LYTYPGLQDRRRLLSGDNQDRLIRPVDTLIPATSDSEWQYNRQVAALLALYFDYARGIGMFPARHPWAAAAPEHIERQTTWSLSLVAAAHVFTHSGHVASSFWYSNRLSPTQTSPSRRRRQVCPPNGSHKRDANCCPACHAISKHSSSF